MIANASGLWKSLEDARYTNKNIITEVSRMIASESGLWKSLEDARYY